MIRPPEDKDPVGAVPQAGQEHDDGQIPQGVPPGAAIAPQGDVQVVPEPGGQRNVPPAPKFRGRPGKIREPEILHEVDPQQFGGPPGDIGITGKIGVNLEGEGHHADHRPVSVEAGLGVKGIVGQDGAIIRHKHLFKEPHQHQAQAVLEMGILKAGPFFQLRDKIFPPLDGP